MKVSAVFAYVDVLMFSLYVNELQIYGLLLIYSFTKAVPVGKMSVRPYNYPSIAYDSSIIFLNGWVS